MAFSPSLLAEFGDARPYTLPSSSGHYKAGRRQSLTNFQAASTGANIEGIKGQGTMLYSKPCAIDHSRVLEHMAVGVGSKRMMTSKMRVGSTVPSCTLQCGYCMPCVAVHVPVHPRGEKHNQMGVLEYYPEAWRCKCKNKLFVPGLSPHP
ncbi:hypothetical protein GOP47_0016347 [Adiantum capillus-veneris]|uniref:Epidermal patterning factor-like protein n=1 Tax=Adiantum capillus-veneris TaxID=13818 RepID=A0A9D4ZBN4_ADICA|nr:hypothetical protein GOP47_0016347 [Adiantum capillus-veneris]